MYDIFERKMAQVTRQNSAHHLRSLAVALLINTMRSRPSLVVADSTENLLLRS
jgi:hypothetical protein